MDHSTGAGVSGELPQFNDAPGPYSGPHRPNGIFVIRYRNLAKGAQQPDFIRGYGFQGTATPDFNMGAEGFGATYKRAVRQGVYRIGAASHYVAQYGDSRFWYFRFRLHSFSS
jgi:hypothetical protein